MKVCLVTNFPFYSGTGKVPYCLWSTLNSQKLCEADLYLTHFLKDEEKYAGENKNVRVLHPFAYDKNPALSRLMIYFLDPFLLPNGYDVYHFGNHMIARFSRFRKPSVVTVHDVLQFKYPEKMENGLSSKIYNCFMERSIRSLPLAGRLICVSNWSKGELLKIFTDLNPDKVSVIYNGLNHGIFYPRDKRESRQRLNLPQDRPIILHLGSEISRKQVPLLIRAFKELKKTHPDALLVRHGEKKESTAKLIQELGLGKDIIYYGYTPEEDLPLFYSAADVLVQPSSEEGFCFPVIEAMACGLPVVATNRASLPEVCGGAEAVVITEISEEGILSALIRALSVSEEEKNNIVDKGFNNAKRFDWKNAALSVFSVYERVLEEKNK